jgi:hypothetical protein
MPPFLEVERRHYHLNQAELAGKIWGVSLLVLGCHGVAANMVLQLEEG